MRSFKHHVRSPAGMAQLLARGIRANFAPTHQAAEQERLVEFLQDLAMSRAQDAELPGQNAFVTRQAAEDAQWLEAIASALDGPYVRSQIIPQQ